MGGGGRVRQFRLVKNFFFVFGLCQDFFWHPNPFAPGDFAEKRVLKLVERFSGHCRAIKSSNVPQSRLQVVHLTAF